MMPPAIVPLRGWRLWAWRAFLVAGVALGLAWRRRGQIGLVLLAGLILLAGVALERCR